MKVLVKWANTHPNLSETNFINVEKLNVDSGSGLLCIHHQGSKTIATVVNLREIKYYQVIE